MSSKNLHIKKVFSSGNWEPLFRNLPGWGLKEGIFTDGKHIFSHGEKLSFELQSNNQDIFDKVGLMDGVENKNKDYFEIKSPGNIFIPVHYKENRGNSVSPYLLNHVAVSVENIDKESEWWKDLFQCKEVLKVDQGFDPIVNGSLNTYHLYKEKELYVTLREQLPIGEHHFGFEITEENKISECKDILGKVGWPIFWEGMIDQSYVIHFTGPDGLIHDFFYPNANLKRIANI